MSDDKYEDLGPALARIGQALAERFDGDPNGLFFYVEIEEGMLDTSVFKDEGPSVRYLDLADRELDTIVFDAWYAEDADKRWASMEYEIKNNKFTAAFKFPGEIDAEEDSMDRRDRILRARYGDKPVVYPPWSDDDGWELRLKQ